jgi:hypothetical protein
MRPVNLALRFALELAALAAFAAAAVVNAGLPRLLNQTVPSREGRP